MKQEEYMRMETKEKMKDVTPKELIEIIIENENISPEDIYEWAVAADDKKYVNQVKEKRNEVRRAFEEYNAMLGYEESLDSEFWDYIFDLYEEAMTGNIDIMDAWKELYIDEDEDGDEPEPSQTKDESTEGEEEELYELILRLLGE